MAINLFNVTISAISDDNSKNELKSFNYNDYAQAKDKFVASMQSIYNDILASNCQIDFEHTYIFDKYNGCWVFNAIDDKQIKHMFRVSISIVS